jgi:hypothetical protein
VGFFEALPTGVEMLPTALHDFQQFNQRDVDPYLGCPNGCGYGNSGSFFGGVDPRAPLPPGFDPRTWRIGPPSRTSARPYNKFDNYYDPEGGEYRYAPPDAYHNAHWDYKAGSNSPWENVPIDDVPPIKFPLPEGEIPIG